MSLIAVIDSPFMCRDNRSARSVRLRLAFPGPKSKLLSRQGFIISSRTSTFPGTINATIRPERSSTHSSLAGMVQSYSVKHLQDPTSRFTLSLSFLRHGSQPEVDLGQVEPVFRTTCSIRMMEGQPVAYVLEPLVDEDFVRCVANAGCARCRQA